jgi:hypothetical protein
MNRLSTKPFSWITSGEYGEIHSCANPSFPMILLVMEIGGHEQYAEAWKALNGQTLVPNSGQNLEADTPQHLYFNEI